MGDGANPLPPLFGNQYFTPLHCRHCSLPLDGSFLLTLSPCPSRFVNFMCFPLPFYALSSRICLSVFVTQSYLFFALTYLVFDLSLLFQPRCPLYYSCMPASLNNVYSYLLILQGISLNKL